MGKRKTLTNEQGMRLWERDSLNLSAMMSGNPECTHTGAKLHYISTGGYLLLGYDPDGKDIDLRHWN